jgi:predicted flavoprotein YhiN
VRGEAVVTQGGIEGGAIYALSAPLREAVLRDGAARILVDLRPDLSPEALTTRLAAPRGGQSTSTFLRKAAGLSPVGIALLREESEGTLPHEPAALAALIKAVPVTLAGLYPLAQAISTAGGVTLDSTDEHLMLRALPGVFVAGEMLDWEAPTGGYLLQATFATGRAAAQGALAFLGARPADAALT